MKSDNKSSKELLAEARAIHLSMQYGAISYQEAKIKTKPLLKRVNNTIELFAKKHNQKPKYIAFSDLGINL